MYNDHGRPERVPSIWTTPAILPAALASLLLVPLLPLLILILVAALSGTLDPTLILWVVGGVAVAAALSTLAIRLRRRDYARIQESRDQFAIAIAAMLERGETPPPYSLYLRPFFTDGHLTDNEGLRTFSFDVTEIADVGQKHDLERACAQALEDSAPLISLGRPNARLGAGRIETADENWKALFDQLVIHAARLIMVPIGQPATLEEVKTIAATPDLLAKTVFVRPADRRSSKFTFKPDPTVKSVRGMWEWTRHEVADRLPGFPPFAGGPRMITFPAGEPPVEFPGNGWSIQQPSGVKTFLAEGRTNVATTMLLLALWPAIAFASAGPVRLPLFMDIEAFGYDPELAQAMAGVAYLQLAAPLSLITIAFYKLFTADLPRSVALPITIVMVSILADCVLFSWFLGRAEGWDVSESLRIQSLVIFIGAACRNLLIAVAAACLTGGRLRWQHLLLIFGPLLLFHLVSDATRQYVFAHEGVYPFPGLDWFVMITPAIGILLALLVPVIGRVQVPWHRWGVLLLGAAVATAAYLVMWLDPDIPISAYRDDPCYNMGCEIPRWTAFNWGLYRVGLLTSAIVLAFPLLVRAPFGIGRERRWAEPI